MGTDGKEALTVCHLSLGASAQSVLERGSPPLECGDLQHDSQRSPPHLLVLPGALHSSTVTGALFFSPNLPLTPLPPIFWVSLALFGTRARVWELQALPPARPLLWLCGPSIRPALPLTSEAPPQQLFLPSWQHPFVLLSVSHQQYFTCTDLSSLYH